MSNMSELVWSTTLPLVMDSTSNKSANVTLSISKTVSAQKSWITTDLAKMIPFYVVIFLLSVIGNILVICTLIYLRRMRTITNLFLLNLSISDLFLGVFCMPFTLVGSLLRNFIFGGVMCKMLPYFQGEILTRESQLDQRLQTIWIFF